MKRKKIPGLWQGILLLCFVFPVFFTSCKETLEDDVKKIDYDPSKPVTLSHFTPDSGRVATQLLIHGSNFGSDKSQISVFVKDKKAAVINVDPQGTLIYCIVPSLRGEGESPEDGDIDMASVKVKIANKEVEFPERLVYTYSHNVSTFLGFTDQDGNTAIVDGNFDVAQFQSPFWLAFDTDEDGPPDAQGKPKKNIYLIEENSGLRYIDLYDKTVSTVFKTGNGVARPRTIAFTLKVRDGQMIPKSIGDTMIIANDGDDWGWIGTIIIPRDPITRRFQASWRAVMHHKQCNGGAIHPTSGDYWFNSYNKSQIYKVFNRSNEIWRYGGPTANDLNTNGAEGTKYFFLVQDNSWEFNIQIAPSGDFAYIVSKNQHYIAKMVYVREKGQFERPFPFVGSAKKSGFKDGLNLDVLFNQPQQGAFDNEDNFYVCDGENNCIRKVTPNGQVSIFAGRPGNPGYSDGALRDAQFDGPFGIIYDDDIKTFYVADRDNRRIRSIKVE